VKKSWFRQTIDTLFGREEFEDSMLRPYGVYSRGTRIYVTDPGFGLVHIFDSGKQEYSRIAKGDEDVLISPIGIAAEPDGTIYVSDSVLRKVFVYDIDGVLLRTIGSPELLVRPSGIAVHADRVYVVDTHGHQVLAFDKTKGDLLLRFGKKGSAKADFNFPTNIFITAEGLLFVTDSLNFRIQSFSSEGVFLGAFGKHGDGSGDFSKPKGIALDSEGHVYVADAHFDNVQIFDQKGTFLLSFGNPGRAKGEMLLPAGLFIDENDRVYVADSYNRRVQVFQYLREPQQRVMVK
jgi:DNA-binding beta-propeller fold protein YncE